MIDYLFDENVHPVYRNELKRLNPEITVWLVGDPGTPPKSTKDPEILNWCEDNNFILITNNRRSMPLHIKDHISEKKHFPGIFILNDKMSIGQTLDELNLIWGASEKDEYQDTIQYLPISYDLD